MNIRCLLLVGLMVLGGLALSANAQDADTWGHDGALSKWYRLSGSWNPESNYKYYGKYYGQTPRLEDFPKLLAEAKSFVPNEENGRDREYIYEHLATVSRCDFSTYLYGNSDGKPGHANAVARWEEWWDHYGKQYLAEYQKNGRRYPDAWKRLPRAEGKPCPNYKILLPEVWSMTLKFRPGNDFGIEGEVISLEVNHEECRLRRRYNFSYFAEGPWRHEEWQDFSREEADQFLAMLIYAIDNPWIYAGDRWAEDYMEIEIAGRKMKLAHVRGRGERWTTLYSSAKWSGILDEHGQVLVNDDSPRSHTTTHPDVNAMIKAWNERDTWMGTHLGLAFAVVRDCFPDPSWKPGESRWECTDLQHFREDILPVPEVILPR